MDKQDNNINALDESEMCAEEKQLLCEIEELRQKIDSARRVVQDTDFFKVTEHIQELGRLKFSVRKKLRGHLAKVNHAQWASDSQLVVSASQDGKLIVWDGYTGCKVHMIPLKTAWVVGCCMSPSQRYVCSGGLDNIVSVFDLETNDVPVKLINELGGHSGYISCCRYISGNEKIITSSGDKTCKLWDVERSVVLETFLGHTNDVNSVAISKNSQTFISVSSDKTQRVWDATSGKCIQLFEGHEQDVNGVDYFPSEDIAFVTSSDDGSCRLWDLRSDQPIAVYIDDYVTCGSTSVAMSKSGRLLIAGYDDFNCHVWDCLREERVGIMSAHDGRISSVCVSPDGIGVFTASWDSMCLIWTAKS